MKEMIDIELGQLTRWEYFYKANVDYFTLVDIDCNHLRGGRRLVYALDPYEANALVCPREVWTPKPNRYYDATRAMWESLLVDSKNLPNITIAIGPLALLECLVYLKQYARDVLDGHGVASLRNLDVNAIVAGIEKDLKREVDSTMVPWSAIGTELRAAWIQMTRAVNLVKTFDDKTTPSGLIKLFQLIKQGDIKYLDTLLEELELSPPSDFFNTPPQGIDPTQGLQYLNARRGMDQWRRMYNALDITRLIAAGQLQPLFLKKNVVSSITTVGQLTLNAWDRSYTGDMATRPFRPSMTASYVTQLLRRYHSDWSAIARETEEARVAARRVSRHLSEIEEVRACWTAEGRAKLKKDLRIAVPDTLIIEILNWQESHYSELNPLRRGEAGESIFGTRGMTVDLHELVKWRDERQRRTKLAERIRDETSQLLNSQEFLDLDRCPFIGPVGDAYEEVNKWLYGK